MEYRIMSTIKDYATRQNERLDKIDASLTGITDDVKVMQEMIENLQNNPGPISPEDQQLLDALEARGDALAAKLADLDAAHPAPTPGDTPTGPNPAARQPNRPNA
jgi:hypothetical protein